MYLQHTHILLALPLPLYQLPINQMQMSKLIQLICSRCNAANIDHDIIIAPSRSYSFDPRSETLEDDEGFDINWRIVGVDNDGSPDEISTAVCWIDQSQYIQQILERAFLNGDLQQRDNKEGLDCQTSNCRTVRQIRATALSVRRNPVNIR